MKHRPFYFPWEPPFQFLHRAGIIVDAHGKMFAEMRGWGFLTGRGESAARLSHEEGAVIQDKMGHHLVEIINRAAGLGPPLPVDFEAWVERARDEGQVKGITYPIVRRAFEAGHDKAQKENEAFLLQLLDVATGHNADVPPSLHRIEEMLVAKLFPDKVHNHVVTLMADQIEESKKVLEAIHPMLSFTPALVAIPGEHPVRPLFTKAEKDAAVDLAQCGTCHHFWDDGIATGWTPTPGGRCPFEEYHQNEEPDQDES